MNDKEEIELLKEAVRWLRFQSIDKAKAAVAEHLNTDAKKQVFELTDGAATVRAIEEKTGVNKSKVSSWWNAWYSAGILVKEDGIYTRLFSLTELGIEMQTPSGKVGASRKGNK